MNENVVRVPGVEGTRRPPPGLLLMAHGSKDPAGQQELRALEMAVQAATSRRLVALGVLEYPGLQVPAISDAADGLVAAGARVIVAVPVLLLQAGHGKMDMPQQFAQIRARHPGVRCVMAQPLLPHPLLRAVAQQRLEQCITEPWRPPGRDVSTEVDGAIHAEHGMDTAVLLVGRGSHDPAANSDLFKIARLFSEEYGHPLVETCFISQATPGVPEGIGRCVALGARSVVIVPYFLHTGILVQRIQTQVLETQQRHPNVPLHVAQHLGNHPNLIRLLLLRAREASLGLRAMACLAGAEPPPGFLPIVAKAPGQSHQHQHPAQHHDYTPLQEEVFVPTPNERWYLRVTADWAARLQQGASVGPDPALTERDVAFARRTLHLKAGMRVLETGCGWGRCTVELARLGCRVTAVDLSPPMAARTRQSLEEAGLVADVRLATVRLLPLFQEPFDAIVGFRDDSPISAGDESDNLHTLQSLADALRPGGRLLFGTGDYPHMSLAYQRLVRQTLAGEVVEEIHYDAATGWSVNESRWQLPDGPLHLTRKRKHYDPNSVAVLLKAVGLQLVATYANLDETCPYPSRPEGLIVVATRVNGGDGRP